MPSINLPPLPVQSPVTNSSGKLTPDWERWLKSLEQIIRSL